MSSTHDRILDGALKAISKHGLAGLAMREVGSEAGVARGTVYRHFANRDALLAELGQRELARFVTLWKAHLGGVPAGEARLRVAIEYPSQVLSEHPVVQRLVETDPDYVLRAIRDNYPLILSSMVQLVGPILERNPFAKDGVVPVEQLVDWFVRVMISSLLIPADGAALGRSVSAVHQALRDASAA